MVSYKSSTTEEQLSGQNTRLICKKTKKMIYKLCTGKKCFYETSHFVCARKETVLIQYHVNPVRDGFRNYSLVFKES